MPLRYPHAEPPPAGERIEVAPGVFWLRMPLPFQLDHINLWLLRDGDGWTAIDTGFPNHAMRELWRRIMAGLDGPLRRLIVTHFHPDHLGLAAWLQDETGAELWMTAGEFLTAHAAWNEVGGHGMAFSLAQFRRNGLDEARLQRFERDFVSYGTALPPLPNAYRRVRADEVIAIGGRDWRALIGHGHAPEHLALHCPELGVLISGDMLLPKISTNVPIFPSTPDADALRWYLDSLADLLRAVGDDGTLVLPSHGLPFFGMAERVAELNSHHAERLRELEDSCQNAPQSAADALETLFQRKLDVHQLLFAMGESMAHLNYLEQAGRLSRSTDADGVIRYRRRQAHAAAN